MKRYRTKAAVIGIAALFGSVAAMGTAHAETAQAKLYNSKGQTIGVATSVGTNGQVSICDTLADGKGIYVLYWRVNSDHVFRVTNVDGYQSCRYSGDDESNQIYKLRVCQNDVCGDWVYTMLVIEGGTGARS
jgi:hypothetical protein